ncbi:MAG: helix-turn-helix transcriptional regulator [Gallintestinimicrobium sp.]
MPHLSDEIPLYNPEYLYQQLTRIATESFPSRREQPQNMQQCMEKYIADHLSEPLTLDTVAEAFSITPVYLSSWFKKNLGVNFLNYISAARMERASELLCQPNPPKIYEVAPAVGIDNTATFIRHQETQVSPRLSIRRNG